MTVSTQGAVSCKTSSSQCSPFPVEPGFPPAQVRASVCSCVGLCHAHIWNSLHCFVALQTSIEIIEEFQRKRTKVPQGMGELPDENRLGWQSGNDLRADVIEVLKIMYKQTQPVGERNEDFHNENCNFFIVNRIVREEGKAQA